MVFFTSFECPRPRWAARLRHIYPALTHTLEVDVAIEDLARRGLRSGQAVIVTPAVRVIFAANGNARGWVWQAREAIVAT